MMVVTFSRTESLTFCLNLLELDSLASKTLEIKELLAARFRYSRSPHLRLVWRTDRWRWVWRKSLHNSAFERLLPAIRQLPNPDDAVIVK